MSKGNALKKTWVGEVTSIDKLAKAIASGMAPSSLIQINQSALNAYAKAVKGGVDLPGVKFYEKASLSVRT